MPRHVDHEQRRLEIVRATMEIVAERGTRGLSFRAVASRMGGSTTLITHYFPTQQALIDEVAATAVKLWDNQIRELDAQSDDPFRRLYNLLVWLVPTTDDGLAGERSRINLLSGQILGEENRATFETWDTTIRGFLRSHLEGLVPPGDVERTVELLRVTTNGVVLSVVEHPDSWPTERQLAVIDGVLQLLGLTSKPADGKSRSRARR
ncbi:AcrR family transcriptional regulator [Kibdelosporangium banguiense]|uniref:AcrR family transcriptional regulator n=1 Tax=Kibdelosporangium banguiense TaxID=1365924 RepID=A0ABS4TS38_9PSEU|nr:TetR/AcrR family transcriptional regulator [Kibdelosporangium banguiense]MBP2327211.1 AcrR family transcriptional regulator [Kibdelosporangium banguiense]